MPDETIWIAPQPEVMLLVDDPTDSVVLVEEDIEVIQVTTPGPQGPAGGPGATTVSFGLTGPLAVGQGLLRWYNDFSAPMRIVSVRLTVGLSPRGGADVIDVNVNQLSVFTDPDLRPSVDPGLFTDQTVPDRFLVPPGSYVTADIDEVGPEFPGEHAFVQVYLTGAAA